MPPLIELANATVVKNGVRILDRLTVTITAGEHTAVIGPNGAGKSTFINLLTHDDRAWAGPSTSLRAGEPVASPVRVFGSDRWNVFDLRARLGVVSAELHHRFVNGNSAGRIIARDAVVSGFFAAHGFVRDDETTPEMRARAMDALARMEVAHLQDAPLDQMSTGEARRVLIARALVTSPEALVLDEPTTGLDVVARHRFLETIRHIARQGTTILLVTHRVEEIIPEIASVVLLKKGKVAAAGAKASVLTSANLSAVFDEPITLSEADGYYHARLGSTAL